MATSVEKVPSGDRWIHEIKFDGYRVQQHIHNDAIKVLTRRPIGSLARELLLRRSRQAETPAHISDWLRVAAA